MTKDEFDNTMKSMEELIADGNTDEETEDFGVSDRDLFASAGNKRQTTMEKERQTRQAKKKKEREAEREKILDKYNIKKEDELSSLSYDKAATTRLNKNKTDEECQMTNVVNQGFDPTKMATNLFSDLKKKLK
ncbi:unnamed protein product [Rotaria sordida]|uniref:Uncharacterized protein n=1 Tax=Rotaria sordida TaxID=392033 RepID=A0A815PQQ0_9BILA|nr:unnamed protein product [Rotaria sordida]CAF1452562.1 unnamed protein product [Rotaria sordida]